MLKPIRLMTAATSHGLRVAQIETRAAQAWLGRYTAQRRPKRPRAIQLPVNDICNSRCSMCNIWKRKRDHEITPGELRSVLTDTLFREVTYVGLSGGEPTLRKDLPQIGETLCETLPKLEAVNIITNAIQTKNVLERIVSLHNTVTQHNKQFTVSVSLDGIGDVHDQNRGVEGNFNSAVNVIEQLQQHNITVSVGCTLTTLNAYGADDLLTWCDDRNLDFVFRLGVEIERVYNDGYDLLNPMTEAMKFHLATFFDKLAHHSRTTPARVRFYRSLANQIALNKPRAVGCHWQTDGVTLDTRGDISYCSVKSPIVGSALKQSAWKLFRKHVNKRRAILKNDCADCKHDLAGPALPRTIAKEGWDELLRPLRDRLRYRKAHRLAHHPDSVRPKAGSAQLAKYEHPAQWRNVLITGWFGSETAGDKAILGELAHVIKTANPNCQITVTTIDRKVSEQTRRELIDLADSDIIDLHTAHKHAQKFDAIILGGGPVQPMAELEHVWNLFKAANKAQAARIIFGCGVGELSGLAQCYAQGIFQYTTAGFLRDETSHQRAIALGGPINLTVGCDPAIRYVRRWQLDHPNTSPAHQPQVSIVGLLRANTSEYVQQMDDRKLAHCNKITAKQLAESMTGHHAQVDLLAMGSIPIAGDDRLFNRQVADAFADVSQVKVERCYLTLNQTLHRLADADVAVAMRYHGHLFALALGIPMLSVDYTSQGGKVASLIERIDYQRFSQTWAGFNPTTAHQQLAQLIAQRSHQSSQLLHHADRMIVQLERVYRSTLMIDVTPCAAQPTIAETRLAA